METARKVTAALVGVLIIILLVLLARWVGDQIRSRLTKSQQPATPTMESTTTTPNLPVYTPQEPVATPAAIPATGPSDFLYPLLAFFFVTGSTAVALSKKIVS